MNTQDIQACIASEHYLTAADATRANSAETPLFLLHFCVLVLKNGYTVTGTCRFHDFESMNVEIARKVSRANAVQKIWALEEYSRKQQAAGK